MAAKKGRGRPKKPTAETDSTPPADVESVGEIPDTGHTAATETVASTTNPVEMPDLSGDINVGHAIPTATENPYHLPASCDVFDVKPDTLESQRKRKMDVHVLAVRIWKTAPTGEHKRIPGQFPPHVVSTQWLEKTHGPGVYLCKGVNAAGSFVTTGQIPIGMPEQPVTGGFDWTTGGAASSKPTDPLQALLFKMLEEKITGPAGEDPMRSAMAEMMKMQAMQMNMMMQGMQLQMQQKKADAEPSNQMVQTLLAAFLKNAGKQAGGGSPEMMQALQMGLVMGRQLAGNPSGEPKEDPDWLKALTVTTEAMGAPLVAAVAQATLPKERADQVVEAVQSHMKTREAEAAAAANTIDVDGDEIPEVGKVGT